MRGLTVFIGDIRKCKGKEDEIRRINKELANIRSKFKSSKLDGYSKKKYVCKLIFIFLLGYECDLGHEQAINLMLSNTYSEKQIGYLFTSVVKGENHNFMPLIIRTVKNEISSKNRFFQHLALQFVANSATLDVAEALIEQVLELLLNSNTAAFVRQTAALTLLQLLRIKPLDCLNLNSSQINNITDLISNDHLGIVIASASLIGFMAKNSVQCQSCLPHCIMKLSKIVTATSKDFSEYTYQDNTAPWLTVKLLQLLQYFHAPTDTQVKHSLQVCLNMILNEANKQVKEGKNKGYYAICAIIFEAISLIIHMELDSSLMHRATELLVNSLKHKHPNIRFTALDMLTKLSSNETCLQKVKARWESVLNILRKESDLTIKKQAVDLLYIICDEVHVKQIVGEMLYFLASENDYLDHVVLKAATLAEKFGKNSQWYIDTIFHMLKICGDTVDKSIWYTMLNAIIDDDAIQTYAAKVSYAALNATLCYDSIIMVAGYILGEFGHLIAGNPQSSYTKQLNILREKYYSCSYSTRAILLTTYMKFLSIYPDLKGEIQSILRKKCNLLCGNEEIQKRAVEYLKLSDIASEELLATALGEITSYTSCKFGLTSAYENQYLEQFNIMQKCMKKSNMTKMEHFCSVQHLNNPVDLNEYEITPAVSTCSLNDSTSMSKNHNPFKSATKETASFNIASTTVPEPVFTPMKQETDIHYFKIL